MSGSALYLTFKILPRPLLSQVNHEVQVEESISVYDRAMQNRTTEIESETASFEAEREEMRQLEDYFNRYGRLACETPQYRVLDLV